MLLKYFDLVADSGLRHKLLLRCTREAAEPRRCLECFKGFEWWKALST